MSWVRSPAGRAILAVVAIYAVMVAFAVGLNLSGLELGRGVRAGIAVAFAVPVAWLALNYWRAIDEAAREAQKWAWFWGGSGGMAAALEAERRASASSGPGDSVASVAR